MMATEKMINDERIAHETSIRNSPFRPLTARRRVRAGEAKAR